ncbi:MAG: hypothetical protein ACR2QK_13335 [Acidimicrobiales bacterium]
MSDDRSPGGRDLTPDFIPDTVVEEHGEIARVTVVSSRSLSDIRKPNVFELALDRLRRGTPRHWLSLFLVLSAVLSSVVWITVGPESTPLFVAASLLCVAAIVSTILWIWKANHSELRIPTFAIEESDP